MQAALCRTGGSVLDMRRSQVEIEADAEGILNWFDAVIPSLIKNCECKYGQSPRGIGVGFGGIVERDTGIIDHSVHVKGWERLPLKARLERQFGIPAIVENDTVCGGYAEYRLGAGKGAKGFFYTNIGSGIGGAIFIDGKPVLGQSLGAAYFGQTCVPDWNKVGETERIENLCSGFAIERRLQTSGYVPCDSAMFTLTNGKTENMDCRLLGQCSFTEDAVPIGAMLFAEKRVKRIQITTINNNKF